MLVFQRLLQGTKAKYFLEPAGPGQEDPPPMPPPRDPPEFEDEVPASPVSPLAGREAASQLPSDIKQNKKEPLDHSKIPFYFSFQAERNVRMCP